MSENLTFLKKDFTFTDHGNATTAEDGCTTLGNRLQVGNG